MGLFKKKPPETGMAAELKGAPPPHGRKCAVGLTRSALYPWRGFSLQRWAMQRVPACL